MFKLVVLVSLVSVALAGYGVPAKNPPPAAAAPMYPVYPPAFYPYPRRHRHRHHHHHHHDDSSSSSSESDSHSHEKIRCKSCRKLTANCNNIADVELCRKPNITVVTQYGCAHAIVSCPADAEYFLIHDRNTSNVLLFGKANDVFAKCNKGKSWIINGTTVNNVACIVPKKNCGLNAEPSSCGCECVTGFTDILDTTLPDRVNYTERGMKCISNDPCKTVAEPFTIIFVIDSSSSIGQNYWGYLLSFLELAAPLLPKTSRVGFVKYGGHVSDKLMVKDNWTVQDFLDAIPRFFDDSVTRTDLGLTAAADLLQNDPNNRRNVVLFTDGAPSYVDGMAPALDLLKSVNAKVRVMGFGAVLVYTEDTIKSWLDNPQEDYFPFYQSPQALTSAHMNSILTSVCEA